ncbi:NLR family CARD domain-containing protein 3-like isoform X4 [Narcine bancroftii]|uniref:NLR family CARD domain-containing protein 3-like isoform X4 n=1 Tax=Narcine bancroftii TaxID=1343680 RepID=UPI0038314724
MRKPEIWLPFELVTFYILSSVATLDVKVFPAVFNATIGEEVLLNCLFSQTIEFDLMYIVIEWNQRAGDHEKAICLLDFGEYESYRPGSSLFQNEISKGNASLLLKNVTVDDIGSYSCIVSLFSDKNMGNVNLSITAPPVVSINTVNIIMEPGEDKVIISVMQNFYPEKLSVSWLKNNSKDNESQVNITSQAVAGTQQRNQDGTFNLISFLIIKGNKGDDGVFYICRVTHEALKVPIQKAVGLTIKGSTLTSRSRILFAAVVTFLLTAVICYGTCVFYNQRTDTPRVSNIIISNYWNKANPLSLTCAVFWFRPKSIVISWSRGEVGKFHRTLISKWDSASHCAGKKTESYFQNEQGQVERMPFTRGEYDVAVSLKDHKECGMHSLISQLTFRGEKVAKREQAYYFEVLHYAFEQPILKTVVVEIKEISEAVAKHKLTLKAQMERIKPYFAFDNSRPLLLDHFTNLVILNARERNKIEHELLQHRDYTACEHIDMKHLFSPSDPWKQLPRVTLVQGVAGIGKSVMIQKLAHSWACGTLYTRFCLLLYFNFRELNTITKEISLTELITCAYPHLTASCKELLKFPARILFLLDGLDEFKWSLEFNVQSVDEPSIAQPINHLIVSIIKGDLLHGATVLVTSRPTSIDLDHKTYFDRCVEILGFSTREIAAYFRKCLKDKKVANHVFQTVKSIDSLYGLCYVPAFCDILCFYLHKSFRCKGKWSNLSSFPRTITDLFLRFTKCLLVQTKDEEENPESFCIEDSQDRNEILNLARLAWDGIINKVIIFSPEDIERNISQKGKTTNAFWKKILTKESMELMHSHIWQFFHLTHQEFFAALYCTSGVDHVHQAFNSKSNTFEFVLRFTAGLISHSNRKLVKQLMPEHQVEEREVFLAIENAAAVDVPKEDLLTPENVKKYTSHKRQKLIASHCLHEAANKDLTKLVAAKTSDIVNFSYISLNVTDCTVIGNLLSHHTTIETLELDGCKAGASGLQRLESVFSRVKTLSLEGNMLKDEGAELIANALKIETCKIETLRLKHNSIGEKGAAQIAEALKTNSRLEVLGLRANVVEAKGAKLLAEALEINSTLRVLGLQCNKIGDQGAMYMAQAIERNRSLVELRLGGNEITDKGSDYFRRALEVNSTLEELWILVNNISSGEKKRLTNARYKNPNLRLN